MIVLAIFRLGIGGTGLSALAGALFIAPYIILLPPGSVTVGAAGLLLSLTGQFGALRMPPAPPADPTLRLGFNVAADSWRIVRSASRLRPIWLSVLGLSWFWTMGATLMTEFPIVARDTMRPDGSVLTLLLSVFAIGVGLGSIGCARLLRGEAPARRRGWRPVGRRHLVCCGSRRGRTCWRRC